MSLDLAAEPMDVGDASGLVRAAIDLVARGQASRVTVHAPAAGQVLLGARALGRALCVKVEAMRWIADEGCDIVISAQSQ